MQSVNIIAATTSKGQVFFTVNRGRMNSNTFCYFVQKLITHLKSNDSKEYEDCVIMLDNAAYHRSRKTKEFIERSRIQVMFLGPYQFSMAPVENLFAFIKNHNLNPLLSRAYSLYSASC